MDFDTRPPCKIKSEALKKNLAKISETSCLSPVRLFPDSPDQAVDEVENNTTLGTVQLVRDQGEVQSITTALLQIPVKVRILRPRQCHRRPRHLEVIASALFLNIVSIAMPQRVYP